MAITKQEALSIAREECKRRGWPLFEETSVRWGFFTYTVWIGYRIIWVRIRKKDGAVLDVGMGTR